jgi:hypothetical protein
MCCSPLRARSSGICGYLQPRVSTTIDQDYFGIVAVELLHKDVPPLEYGALIDVTLVRDFAGIDVESFSQ